MNEGAPQILLAALPIVPAVGAIVAGVLPVRLRSGIRAVGWTFSIGALLVWMALRAVLSGGEGLLVTLDWPWVPTLGISIHLGLDGTGVMMAGMLAFVGVAAVVGTLPSSPEANRSHTICLLLAEAGMLGVVAAWDLILFITFWEVTLVAFFLLMIRGRRWSSIVSATRFVITSVISSVMMWVGILWLVRLAGPPISFDLEVLTGRLSAMEPGTLPAGMVWLFAAAFLVRMAALPLHTWFPAAVAEAQTAASILLAGGLLPLGGYGIVHVLGRLFGADLGGAGVWLGWIGLVTALGGGLASIVQRDLKRLFAFICLAQTGLALAGLASPSPTVRQGGLMMLVAVGLGGTCLFLFAGVVCRARMSQRLADIGGLWRSQPLFAGLAFVGVASAAAVPATVGFIGAFRLLWGSAADLLATALAAGAILVIGSSVTWAYRRVLGGSFHREMWTLKKWPRKRQVGIMLLLTAAIIIAGLFPGLVAPTDGPTGTATVAQVALSSGLGERP